LVKAELEHREYSPAGLLLEFLQSVEIPWVENGGFFADSVGIEAEGHPNMRVVKIVRRADAEPMHSRILTLAPKLFQMPVETLRFREKARLLRIAV
jgi:hypothetical protein